jgi:hypothetical protein
VFIHEAPSRWALHLAAGEQWNGDDIGGAVVNATGGYRLEAAATFGAMDPDPPDPTLTA